jgi:hypothetical protein
MNPPKKETLVKAGIGAVAAAAITTLAVTAIGGPKEKPGTIDTGCVARQADGGYVASWSAPVQPKEGPRYVDSEQAPIQGTDARKKAEDFLGVLKQLRNSPPDAGR